MIQKLKTLLFVCFQLDLQLQDEAGGDISSFITNGEWDLLGVCTFYSPRTKNPYIFYYKKIKKNKNFEIPET